MHFIVDKAWKFAEKAHEGQKRKGSGVDYFKHCVFVRTTVAGRVSIAGEAAALLHDTIEDTDVEDLSMFPLRTQQIVDLLTRKKGESKYDAIQKIGDSMDVETIKIKVADRIHNLSDGSKYFGKDWLERYLESSWHIYKIAVANDLDNFDLTIMLKDRIEELEKTLY